LATIQIKNMLKKITEEKKGHFQQESLIEEFAKSLSLNYLKPKIYG